MPHSIVSKQTVYPSSSTKSLSMIFLMIFFAFSNALSKIPFSIALSSIASWLTESKVRTSSTLTGLNSPSFLSSVSMLSLSFWCERILAFGILCSYGSTGRQLPHKKGWIRHGHFSPASYPAFVSFEQSTLRWLIASIARAVWSVNHIYCTFAHQMYTLPCYRPPDSSSILFIFCCNGGCALSGASSGKAV